MIPKFGGHSKLFFSVAQLFILGYNKNTGFPNRLKVMVSEIDENLDVPTNNSIKVQNFTTQFEDLF